MEKIDLTKEQLASLQRPRLHYFWITRLFFFGMDLLTGKRITLSKAKLLETLACIPYREWEFRQYANITKAFRNLQRVKSSQSILQWGREAQDNEYWHLLVLHEKMLEDQAKDAWYLAYPIRILMVMVYVMLSRTIAFFNIRWAFLFNAQFEDHAEHVYAQFVSEHPEWENQTVTRPLVLEYAALPNWADIFRRIGLDERDHMNNSFLFSGYPEKIVTYPGMPK